MSTLNSMKRYKKQFYIYFTETAGDIIVSKLQNVAHLEVYKKSDIPQEYHYSKNRRILDILIVADLGYTVVESYHQKYTGSE